MNYSAADLSKSELFIGYVEIDVPSSNTDQEALLAAKKTRQSRSIDGWNQQIQTFNGIVGKPAEMSVSHIFGDCFPTNCQCVQLIKLEVNNWLTNDLFLRYGPLDGLINFENISKR